MELLSTIEAAKKIGVTPGRVRQYVTEGKLKGQKIGRDLFFDPKEVARFETPPIGRPRKDRRKKWY